jgi:hypothetical protein
MRRHAQYGGSRSHLRRCHRPLICTGHHLLPPWPPQSCLSSAHFLSSKPPTQADTSQSTQSKSRRVPTHSIDTVSYKQRASVNILKPPASTSHLTEDPNAGSANFPSLSSSSPPTTLPPMSANPPPSRSGSSGAAAGRLLSYLPPPPPPPPQPYTPPPPPPP